MRNLPAQAGGGAGNVGPLWIRAVLVVGVLAVPETGKEPTLGHPPVLTSAKFCGAALDADSLVNVINMLCVA